MGQIADEILRLATAKGNITPTDMTTFKPDLYAFCKEKGINVDLLAMVMCLESGVSNGLIDPRAGRTGGCEGIWQACIDNVNGVKQILGINSKGIISQMSATQQLKLFRTYWNSTASWALKGVNVSSLGLGNFYFMVLCPASAKNPLDKPIEALCDGGGSRRQQAAILYGPNNRITPRSAGIGIVKHVNSALRNNGSSLVIPESIASNGKGGAPLLPGDYLGQAVNAVGETVGGAVASIKDFLGGILSAHLSGEHCPPPPYTLQDRIIYTGCRPLIESSKMVGQGMPYPGPNIAGQDGSQQAIPTGVTDTSVAPSAKCGRIPPGGFGLPLKPGFQVTDVYGWRTWTNPPRQHYGIDFGGAGGSMGDPVFAVADGIGVSSRSVKGGNTIKITHCDGSRTRYLHLSRFSPKLGGIGSKANFKKGEVIGYVGNTGIGTGAHLHFEYSTPNGGAVNPALYVARLKNSKGSVIT